MFHLRKSLTIGIWTCSVLVAGAVNATHAKALQQSTIDQNPTPSPAEQTLLAAEAARFQAQLRGDTAALKQLIAPDAIYIHNSGMIQTQSQYLGMLGNGPVHYKSIQPSQRSAKVYGDFGITHGVLAQDAGGDRQSVARYTGVYARRNGEWQLLSWQTTPMNPPSQRPPAPAGPPQPH